MYPQFSPIQSSLKMTENESINEVIYAFSIKTLLYGLH